MVVQQLRQRYMACGSPLVHILDPFYLVCVHTHPTFLWVVLRINKICMVTAWWVAVWWVAV